MKKTIKSLMALMSLALIVSSCSSDISDDVNVKKDTTLQPMNFTAIQESSDMPSRTAISGTAINWQAGDKITIWDGTNKNEFTATPSDPATGATLTGKAAKSGTFTAVYPHSAGNSCIYTAIEITGLVIPATQTATAGTYDPAAAIMTAYTETTTLAFKNVCSFLKLTTSAAYTKIVVSVTSGNLAGTFSVSDFGSAPSLTATSGVQEITLTGTMAKDQTYYVAIAPGTVNGLTIKCYFDDYKYVEKSKSGDVTFARNKVYNMGSTSTWSIFKNNGYTYVDLGLSVKWATCNVGATSSGESGHYFAWGETSPQSPATYSWATYKWMTSGQSSWQYVTKYTFADDQKTGCWYSGDTYVGTTVESVNYKNLTTLESSDDAARVNWGGSWRMPTSTEIDELMNESNCTWTWTESYNSTGIKGYLVTSKKTGYTSNSIFLPIAGYRRDGNGYNSGFYWSSSLGKSDCAYSLQIYVSGLKTSNEESRYYGQSVRGVCQ